MTFTSSSTNLSMENLYVDHNHSIPLPFVWGRHYWFCFVRPSHFISFLLSRSSIWPAVFKLELGLLTLLSQRSKIRVSMTQILQSFPYQNLSTILTHSHWLFTALPILCTRKQEHVIITFNIKLKIIYYCFRTWEFHEHIYIHFHWILLYLKSYKWNIT